METEVRGKRGREPGPREAERLRLLQWARDLAEEMQKIEINGPECAQTRSVMSQKTAALHAAVRAYDNWVRPTPPANEGADPSADARPRSLV